MAASEVTDPADPRVTDYLQLGDRALRSRPDDPASGPRGRFIAEGDLVIARALDAGLEPLSVLAAPERLSALPRLPPTTAVLVAGPAILEAITGFHVHRGLLASFRRPPERSPATTLEDARRVVVAVGVADPTNLGAMIRSAVALGIDTLLLDERSCDPLYRRSVKVSMGTVFDLPWARIGSPAEGFAHLAKRGFMIAALTTDPGAVDVADLASTPRLALVVGNERHGLPVAVVAAADVVATIPMRAGVDSLNAAAAMAVAAYAVTRGVERAVPLHDGVRA